MTTTNPPAASSSSPPEQFDILLESHETKWPDQPTTTAKVSRLGRIHVVSRQLRLMEEKRKVVTSVYSPIMVSLGPYYHGQNDGMFSRAEEFKRNKCLVSFAGNDQDQKRRLYNRIRGDIDKIKACYDTASIPTPYSDDDQLALIMLLDSCFVLNFMENCARGNWKEWKECLGMAEAVQFTARDIMVLENQIPLFVLDYAISAKYTNNKGIVISDGKELVQRFVSWMLGVDFKDAVIPDEGPNPPLHILEACRRVIAIVPNRANISHAHDHLFFSSSISFKWPFTGPKENTKYLTCPSVTDLKAKGIIFRPRSSHCLKDIKFKSYWISGQFQLPIRSVSELTHVILSNMIAYEISPATTTDLTVLSYTNLMKSLIETPADVKELQDQKIFQINRLSDVEQVVHLFKSIDTFGLENVKIYEDVMQKVGEHCQNKWKIWIAELSYTKFKSPWTIIGLIAAILLIDLTFMQTWFTIHPVKG